MDVAKLTGTCTVRQTEPLLSQHTKTVRYIKKFQYLADFLLKHKRKLSFFFSLPEGFEEIDTTVPLHKFKLYPKAKLNTKAGSSRK